MRPEPSPAPEPTPDRVVDPGASPRARRLARLAFVLSLAPGMVVTMILAPALRDPRLLVGGLVLVAAALLARRRTAILLLDWARVEPTPIDPLLQRQTSERPR